jgi:hypothetical protein
MTRYLLRCALLTGAFALTSFGLLQWQAQGFAIDGIWEFTTPARLHPVYLLVFGVAMIPLSLWEIFLLEPRDPDHEH